MAIEKTDRELLELAAKAIDLNWKDWTPTMFLGETELREWPYDWNPFHDKGNALELALLLHIAIDDTGDVYTPHPESKSFIAGVAGWPTVDIEATCRAIVEAAAYIGESMP